MKYRVPFLDLRITDRQEKKELLYAVNKVLTHGRIVLGPEVEELEKKIAEFCGRKYAVGVNSGTDALILGIKSLGIGRGDEVITTSMSWVATANAIAINGAVPVFADIGEDLNIDPQSVERLITHKTKAIMPVHFTGRISKMDELCKIAKRNNLPVIEDAAQSFGASLKGYKAGSFGKVACFSMNPMKVLSAIGEAGIIVTDDFELYERLISLRYNGTKNKEECVEVSLNGRLDTVQAAMLLVRLKRFQNRIIIRRRNAAYYGKYLKEIKGIVRLPDERKDEFNVYYTYTVRVQRRDELKKYLEKKGIETKIQHPILMPDQPVYKNSPRDKIENAKKIISEILCLPVSEKTEKIHMDIVIENIRKFYAV
jgi:dTDP-4-amino-4,6-dideoxygalactose transaminase